MIALVTTTSVPTFAAGGFDPYFRAPDHDLETARRSGELAAGAYMRVPFSGRSRQSVSETRFGLGLGARLPSVDRPESSHTLADMPKLVDLSIGLTGRDSLRLNGISIASTPRLYANQSGKPKKKIIWPWVVAGVVVFSVLVGVAVGKSIDLTKKPKN